LDRWQQLPQKSITRIHYLDGAHYPRVLARHLSPMYHSHQLASTCQKLGLSHLNACIARFDRQVSCNRLANGLLSILKLAMPKDIRFQAKLSSKSMQSRHMQLPF
jgi:DNA polymerase III alpha subunit (gram-positive type)